MKNVLVLFGLGSLTFIVFCSPLFIYGFYVQATNLYYGGEYEKNKFKVDSIAVVQSNDSQSAVSVDYHIFSKKPEFELIINDNEKVIFGGRKGDDRLVPHLFKYMEKHNDSIWIWYHPKAEIKYAKEEDLSVPLKSDIINLVLYGALIAIAVISVKVFYEKLIRI